MTLTYYDDGPMLTRNATYNGIVGGRGLGKTFAKKKRAIREALTKDRQFILLRRYREELAEARGTFFADIVAKGLFKEWEFRAVGKEFQAAKKIGRVKDESDADFNKRDKQRKWKIIGYSVALSTSQRMKGTSFPQVYTIIFDEFIIEKGHMRYLPDEVTAFNNFYSTVDRWEDRVKVWFLANSVSIMNPYFIAWKIIPDEEGEFVTRHNGFICFHFPDSAKFQSEVFQTRFGQFIAGSEYADYAVGNSFADNHGMLIELKDYRATYMFSLETKHGTFSLWSAKVKGESPYGSSTRYYAQKKRPKAEVLFTLLAEKMNEDKVLMTYRDRPLETLRTAFRTGNMLFDEASTRNTFIDIFERK